MSFVSLGLDKSLCSALSELEFLAPTEVQEQAIPVILGGSDVCASAPTGSGKTGAYLLPVLQALHSRERPAVRRVRVLVLTPTRELAVQVEQDAQSYGRYLEPHTKTCVCVGGLAINPQMMALRGGADVVVATPGRLLDLVANNAADLSEVEVLVLDEADRMLSLGFSDELNELLRMLPPESQKLLFSATFPPAVQGLVHRLLREPTRISIQAELQSGPETITQRAISVDSKRRTKLLLHLLAAHEWRKVLVFVGSGERAHQLTAELKNAGVVTALLHGRLTQEARTNALQEFKSGQLQVLVATDLAARGLDVAQLAAVVNYDLPRSPVDYIHRIGRTGRAGQVGVAVSFISAATEAHYRVIEKSQGLSITREEIPGFLPVEVAPFVQPTDLNGGIKGRRKSKKDKLREAAAKLAREQAPESVQEEAKSTPSSDTSE